MLPLWKIYCKPLTWSTNFKWNSPLDKFHMKCVQPLVVLTSTLYRGGVNLNGGAQHVIPFEIYTPPMQDLQKIYHRVCIDFKGCSQIR